MVQLLYKFAETVVNNCPTDNSLDDVSRNQLCGTGLPQVSASNSTVVTALQLIFAIVGAVAVFYVILGGLKMITSQGDPQSISKARKTIIYAAIGLVIVLSAEAIVTWVIGRL